MLSEDQILQNGKTVIQDEAQDLINLASQLNNNFVKAVQLITHTKGRVIVIGIGKSGHIGAKISATLASTGTLSFFAHPAELLHGDLGMITSDDICLLISNSGETSEITNIIPHLIKRDIQIISITSNSESTLGKLSNITLNTHIAKEAGYLNLAPTSSTTVTLTLGDALALVIMECKQFSRQDFAQFHPGGSLGWKLRKLEDIVNLNRSLPFINIQNTYIDLLQIIAEYNMGFAYVINTDNTDKQPQLMHIITDGDLRRFQMQYKESIFNATVKSLIQNKSKPQVLTGKALAFEAYHLMQEHQISNLCIVNNIEENFITGAITLQELL